MFSHVVVFWTNPANLKAADELLAGMNKYLLPIPGVLHYHAGKMVPSHRPVVEQSYQVDSSNSSPQASSLGVVMLLASMMRHPPTPSKSTQ